MLSAHKSGIMASLKVIISILLVAISSVTASVVGPAPVVAAAPPISYTRAIPYNVPPFAASVNVFTRFPLPAPVVHAPPVLHAAHVHGGLLPPVAAHAALPAPGLPAFIPQARSIHPPSLLPGLGLPGALPPVAAPALAPHYPHALAAPLPHALPAPVAPSFAAHLPHPLAGAAPFPHAFAGHAPLPHALGAPAPPLWRR